jgi:SagB-type dehydrogenase family enzyme
MPIVPEPSARQKLIGTLESDLSLDAFNAQRLFRANYENVVAPVANFSRRSDLRRFVHESRRRYDGVQHTACEPNWRLLDINLLDALHRRSTVREWSERKIEKVVFDTFVSASYGLKPGGRPHQRWLPGAGAIYPLEFYVLNQAVEGLPKGLLHYDPVESRWDHLSDCDYQSWIRRLLPGTSHEPAQKAAAWVAITAVPVRLITKYGVRGWRLLHYDVGVAINQFYIMASALDLGVWPAGNVLEDEWSELSGHDLYRHPIMTSLIVGPRP